MKFLVICFNGFRTPDSKISNRSNLLLYLMEILANEVLVLLIIMIKQYVSIVSLPYYNCDVFKR